MGAIDVAAGRKAAGAARLDAVAKDARAHGFGQLARRAAVLGAA